MSQRDFEPFHPGEILLQEFLKPMGITQYRLAKDISVPQRRISEIVQGKRSITADTALRPDTLKEPFEFPIPIPGDCPINLFSAQIAVSN